MRQAMNVNSIKYFAFAFSLFFIISTICYGNEIVSVKEFAANAKGLKLNIKKDNETLQTIDYEYPQRCFEEAVFVEKRFELLDVNFDGFKDILIYLGSYGNQGVVYKDCFLWNNKNQLFENYNSFQEIPNPQIDEHGKCIYGFFRNHSGHCTYEFYAWNENELACNYRIHKIYSALQLPELYEISVPENKDSGEYMLEYFGLAKMLYESVFYAKENLCEGIAKLEAPSLALPKGIPQKLKELLEE